MAKTKPAFQQIRLRPEMVIIHTGHFYPHARDEIGQVEQLYYSLAIDCLHHGEHELHTGQVDSHTGNLNLFGGMTVYFYGHVRLQMVEIFDKGQAKFYEYIDGKMIEAPGHVPTFVKYWRLQEKENPTDEPA